MAGFVTAGLTLWTTLELGKGEMDSQDSVAAAANFGSLIGDWHFLKKYCSIVLLLQFAATAIASNGVPAITCKYLSRPSSACEAVTGIELEMGVEQLEVAVGCIRAFKRKL